MGEGSRDPRLNVWLESTEALSRLRVVVREARNNDGPIGFKRGMDGVPNEVPAADIDTGKSCPPGPPTRCH
jgi:hypothetical protein